MPVRTTSTLLTARLAGAFYLAIILLGLFGEVVVRGSLVVAGDAGATASHILGAESLWRLGIVTDLLMHVLDVPLIVFFYLLLKPVSRPLALLATGFNIVQTCVLAINKLALVGALSVLEASAGRAAMTDAPALALLMVHLHSEGFAIGLVFFGLACLVRGSLIFKSGHVPRLLGVLLVLAGVSYLTNSLALLLHPPLASLLFPAVLLPALVGEGALCVWLLVADESRLQQRLAAAASGGAPAQ